MFGNALSGWHLVIILLVVLLLFGAPKLPGLARSVGQSMRIFKNEVKTLKDDDKPAEPGAPAESSSAAATPASPEPPIKP